MRVRPDPLIGWHVRAGVSTGGGIKDNSLKVKVEGLGVQVGRMGVSVYDNEFSINFGKLFKF